MGQRSLDYKPKCVFYTRVILSAFVRHDFNSGFPLEKKKKANILTFKISASERNEGGNRGMFLPRFINIYIF